MIGSHLPRLAAVIAGTLATLALAVCGGDAVDVSAWPQELQYGTRDSAGITIVESQRPESGSRLGWVVGDEPAVSVGTTEADAAYQLFQTADATRLADGRVVVANGGSNELLVFDANGDYLAAWGGQGEGPGEFTSLSLVAPWPGDSLIAASSENGRVAIFDLNGTHGRTTTLRGEAGTLTKQLGEGQVDHIVIDALRDGSLFTKGAEGYETTGLWRWEAGYGLMPADGSTPTSLGVYPGPQIYSESYHEDNTVYVMPVRHPFGKTTFSTVWGDLAVIGRTETYEIRTFRIDGSLHGIVRREHQPGSPTQADQDDYFRERFADLPEDERTPRLKIAANVPRVETFPAYADIKSDALGNLWVEEFKLPGAEENGKLWTVFDPDGRALGFVETPEDLAIFEIGADYVLGRVTDALDVETIQMWNLTRPD